MYSDSIIYVSTKYSRYFSWGVIEVMFFMLVYMQSPIIAGFDGGVLVVADGKKKSLFCRIAVLSVLFPIGVLSDCTMVNRLLDARQRFRILLLLFLVFMLLLLPSFFNINLSFYHFVEMSREKRQVIYRFCFLINI
jgi:hypothetical protein